eukprot:CAMPEP_0180225448 /NCGR_PEP_ID=MMETSP0987-20121128/22705_1 /TAXON_ID=697907 /ORGANISM="non described non described, Strain CCMP2293" /LENGTH=442 /DNA_ID=CAMNT_0022188515 /DNA_START=405 /DNA_END=1733 /DNA_ORIENTATION=+
MPPPPPLAAAQAAAAALLLGAPGRRTSPLLSMSINALNDTCPPMEGSSNPPSPERAMARRLSDSALSRCGTDLDMAQEQVPVRVCTFNIHGWRDTDHADNLERLTACIREISPDVLVLQEVLHPYCPPSDPAAAAAYFETVKSGNGNGYPLACEDRTPYLTRLAVAAGLPHISFGHAVGDGYWGAVPYGNAVLSRFPVVGEKHAVMVPDAKHQAGRRIEAEDRCVSAVTLDVSKRGAPNLTVVVTHLDQLSDELRTEQVRAVREFVADAGPHMLVGDFNVFQKADCSDAQWGAIIADADSKGWSHPPERTSALDSLLSSGYRDMFYCSDNHKLGRADPSLALSRAAKDVSHPGATCWVAKPLLRIDYAFLSADMVNANVAQYQRVLDEASDHFPVVVDLRVAPFPRSHGQVVARASSAYSGWGPASSSSGEGSASDEEVCVN